MNEVYAELGLGEKEAALYEFLLEKPGLTGSVIAKRFNEPRSNTYFLLNTLADKGLAEHNDDQPKRRFYAADPSVLRKLVAARQQKLKQTDRLLLSVLPELTAKYRLASHKPGVVYRQGITGLKESLEDMIRSGEEVLLFPSNFDINRNNETFNLLMKGVYKRKVAGIPTRTILHKAALTDYKQIQEYPARGMEVRFFGDKPFDGEVVIYGNKCAFTVYEPELIVTTLTNSQVAATMRTLFEGMWQVAEPLIKPKG